MDSLMARAARLLILAALYTVSFVVMTYPLARDAGNAFVCAPATGSTDAYVFLWNIDQFTRSIRSGGPYFWTDWVVHPIGINLLFHTFCPLYGLAGLIIPDPVRALNTMVFLSFVASGLGGYALCRLFCRSRALCAVAGFAYAYSPYKLARLEGHYNLLLTGAIPFFIRFVIRGLAYDETRKRWRVASTRSLAGAGLCLALTILSDHYYTFYLLLFLTLYLVWPPARHSRLARWAKQQPWTAAAICVIVPTLAVLIRKVLQLQIAMHGQMALTLDVLGLLLPPRNGLLFRGQVPASWYHPHDHVAIHGFYIGYAILLPAAWFLLRRRFAAGPPALAALVFVTAGFALLAMPVVRIHHHPVVALPSVFFYFLPGVGDFREAARAISILMLFLPLFAALAVEERAQRLSAAARLAIAPAWLVLLALEYFQSPLPIVNVRNVPAVYRELARREEGVLLEVPFWLSCGYGSIGDPQVQQQLFQITHQKKLVSGIASRMPQRVFDWYLADPVLRELTHLEQHPEERPSHPTTNEVDACIRRCSIRYVLVPAEYRATAAGRYAEGAFKAKAVRREEIDGALLLTLY
ncbi:MAG TPA: hypothetical protein PLY56_08160 [Armatimonadota bacterium]|jgi:hypothetical protein|nr:hypothetical protein [Armatimonadota bacterium]HOM82566.1 hypothetical protein [Armatimonadota bacterium]HPO72957.1 hypothetical protein [Armatimonadota bacterium]